MKRFIIKLFILTVLPYFYSNAMLTYEITMDAISTNKIERFPGYVVTDTQPYINGGLFFTYPAGLFTTAPVVAITILAAPHASNIIYTAEICTETLAFAEVMVYKNTSGVLTEAATSEVTIHLVAIGT